MSLPSPLSLLSHSPPIAFLTIRSQRMSSQSQSQIVAYSGQLDSLTGKHTGEDDKECVNVESDEEAVYVADARAEGDMTCGEKERKH
jgi:hypothetical protein